MSVIWNGLALTWTANGDGSLSVDIPSYATGGGAPIPVMHGAALTQPPSTKGGPYSGGVVPGNAQYGVLEVFDNGSSSVACRFLGKHATEGTRMTHIFSGSVAGQREQAVRMRLKIREMDMRLMLRLSAKVRAGDEGAEIFIPHPVLRQ